MQTGDCCLGSGVSVLDYCHRCSYINGMNSNQGFVLRWLAPESVSVSVPWMCHLNSPVSGNVDDSLPEMARLD